MRDGDSRLGDGRALCERERRLKRSDATERRVETDGKKHFHYCISSINHFTDNNAEQSRYLFAPLSGHTPQRRTNIRQPLKEKC